MAGADDWYIDVPVAQKGEWLNRTVVDDIFRWGPDYGRVPPVFPLVSDTTFASHTENLDLRKTCWCSIP